ncbi:Uroporphyrinogen-III synthase [Wickerhamomyces ciferrii]|uniref:Uroporphyrinogen-III synthase n=1 Tax=Wickerhamomyces ciferrii (strain ATCC 14091 / BCRC 22168 / CBS 111 / JCM 3599 / NBRC 0793 / NRRL Y-1031 F-60-10) TaxID=1206466 RepID=K0KTP0_WICCF|nr:Uroporphyrinogen-III synthase [Wickerhamomyces ciferrii]CCH44749.1 Uroporphyrinogen-III synthase [Wickerhamomyces ciferrii]
MSTILFLKNKTIPKDPYNELFTQENFDINFIPLLDHKHLELSTIITYLKSHEFLHKTNSLIITSQRAVEVLDLALQQIELDIKSKILNKLAYTVGPATELILGNLGFTNIKGGSEAGNGNILSDIIIETLSSNEKITFFTGETRRDIIPKKLLSKGYDLKEIIIYKTIEKPEIIERFIDVVDNKTGLEKWIVFFSPQGTNEIIKFLKKTLDESEDEDVFKIASIGPTTETYLIENGITPDLVSSKPDANSLLKHIKEFDSHL